MERRPAPALVSLAGLGGLYGWNAFHYGWSRGYDARAYEAYARIVVGGRRLPAPDEVAVWHTPPLFPFVAGYAQAAAERVGWPDDPHRAVQLVDAALALVVAAAAYGVAAELFPRSLTPRFVALALAGLSPVLVKGAAMYHPEPLAAALAAGALYVGVRALRRGTAGVRAGALAGVLLGLGLLTRAWTLAPLAALALALGFEALRSRRREGAVAAVALVLVAGAVASPWFVHQQRAHGSPLAFNRPAPSAPLLERRPFRFYTALPVEEVFRHPYAPAFRNELWPMLYADWWGDWFRYYRVPYRLQTEPATLPPKYGDPLVRQSFVGVLPTLLALAGLLAVVVETVRRRRPELLAVVATLAAAAAAFLFFVVSYPSADGDTVKALYLLYALVPAAVCCGVGADLARRRLPRSATAALAALLAAAAAVDVSYLALGT